MTPMEQPERPRQEGNVHHLETQLGARVQMMIAWEARREAREIVKRKLKTAGREGFADGGERDHTARQRTSAAQRSRTVARG